MEEDQYFPMLYDDDQSRRDRAIHYFIQVYKKKLQNYNLQKMRVPSRYFEDVLGDVFYKFAVKLTNHKEKFDSYRHLNNWFFQVAKNTSLDRLKKRCEDMLEDKEYFQVEAVENYKNRKEEWKFVISRIDKKKDFPLLYMRFIMKMSYKDIAPLLGKSPQALATQFNRLKRNLEEEFKNAKHLFDW